MSAAGHWPGATYKWEINESKKKEVIRESGWAMKGTKK